MVRLYGIEQCNYCKELIELYKNNDIEFTYIDVNDDKNKVECEKLFKIAKTSNVPIVIVKDKILVPAISFQSIPQALEKTKKILFE